MNNIPDKNKVDAFKYFRQPVYFHRFRNIYQLVEVSTHRDK